VLSIVGITSEPDDLVKRGEKYWETKEHSTEVMYSRVKDGDEKLTNPEDESLKQKVDR
jgi:hypothetical protein